MQNNPQTYKNAYSSIDSLELCSFDDAATSQSPSSIPTVTATVIGAVATGRQRPSRHRSWTTLAAAR